ncbi:2-keto-4-pentenoate hydratase/2-oxohepta-3-ene-1,7-dioic acid hydratase in catechol pathway [Methanohalophilus levihalophilus]|uniref:fumarylacetoacetate hydrolase family protein n=1 Tax=Methanohalophilus levihalophilus TaxID=1431282 RepID=UPI001AE451AD|nr:fumarylacetoacetate hydrolase family protein [Methanohalophilus levihalophilus]MBP2031060.1 2-keto-4-pentenoate hydratase/2-oxohepta-3-ene-1,7-dioic acid hydratase in catechol pathway [Methanohalophilus levihalophilus]
MIGRFSDGESQFSASVEGNTIVGNGKSYDISTLSVLPPIIPSKIVCIGLNYRDHAKELHMDIPDEPLLFMKPSSAVIGHGEGIVYPSISQRVDYEAELAVVIGEKCRNVHAENAEEFISGYTCFNDVTARDLQQKDGQWTRAKSFDTFAPLGPFIAENSDFEPSDVGISCRVNGSIKQDSRTSNIIFDIPFLIEFISSVMTLEKGDVIATGTPPGVGPLEKGDKVEVEIEGVGILGNEVL